MSDAKHTPGPWRVNPKASTNVEDQAGRSVAATGGRQDGCEKTYHENQANARLIAAAPALLEALELYRVACGNTAASVDRELVQEAHQRACTAIALAKGEKVDG